MAFSETEKKMIIEEVNAFLEKRRPPIHLRDQLDVGFSIQDQSVEIFEIHPVWNDKSQMQEMPIAKTRYVRIQDRWNIYWMPSDCKWHGYKPKKSVKKLSQFLKEVDEDPFACFWG